MKRGRTPSEFLDPTKIETALASSAYSSPTRIREALARARSLAGLSEEDLAALTAVTDPELLQEIFTTAGAVKQAVYGSRVVLTAKLGLSNLCRNECLYCPNRSSNDRILRRTLTRTEIAEETRNLVNIGHRRVQVRLGGSLADLGFEYVLEALATILSVNEGPGRRIQRVNISAGALEIEQFRHLKEVGAGTFLLPQETYHRDTYSRVHVSGRKADFDFRLATIDLALEAGIDAVGLGVLFGLADWRFELLALVRHIRHLEQEFGWGAHTINLPRIEPTPGSLIACRPPAPLPDSKYRLLLALVRLAVPQAGIILSTRESTAIRRQALGLGASQLAVSPPFQPDDLLFGEVEEEGALDHSIDQRSLDELVRDLAMDGHLPSFCSACGRRGRTGPRFLVVVRPGALAPFCQVNALSTLLEYIEDHATPATVEAGLVAIDRALFSLGAPEAELARTFLDRIRAGERDLFC